MPTFLQHFKHPFYRPSRRSLQDSSPMQRQNKGKQRAKKVYHQDADHVTRCSGERSHETLPVIIDAGPLKAHSYTNECTFWNSTLVEAGCDPKSFHERRGHGSRHPSYDLSPVEAEPWRYVREPCTSIRREIRRSPSPRDLTRRYTESGLDRKLNNMRRGEFMRNDNDITVMLAFSPVHTIDVPSQTFSEKDHILPTPKEWAAFSFPDNPSNDSIHDTNGHSDNPHIVPPGDLSASGCGTAPSQGPSWPHHQHISADQDPLERVLTWNSVLSRILEPESLDSDLKQAVMKRVQASTIVNGSDHGNHPVLTQDAGLVPNYSYPIAASAFYEKVQGSPAAQSDGSNGETRVTNHHGEHKENLLNSMIVSRSSSFDDHNPRRSSSHTRGLPDSLHILLSSVLTPSELSLHYHFLGCAASDKDPPIPSKAAGTNGLTLTPLHSRLILGLHTIVVGRQDRIEHLEDTLIPELSKWLQQTSDELMISRLDMSNTKTEVFDLKSCVDFANRVLKGCWEREWEVWRTLIAIRRRRAQKRGILMRLLSKRRGKTSRDEQILRKYVPERYASDISGDSVDFLNLAEVGIKPERRQESPTEKELDALISMSERNVVILKEDMLEMKDLVHNYQRRVARMRDTERVNGMTRDV